jgi:predicted DNA-binding transcriptional regulator AlpA
MFDLDGSQPRGQHHMHAQSSLLTPDQAAAYMGLAVATLQRQRTEGTGPRFIKLGKRRVAYRAVDLQAWLDGRVADSTADARVRGLAA